MSATPQDVQAKIDAATADLNSALALLTDARDEAGQLDEPPPPPPPPPPGTVLFDGRAQLLTDLRSHEVPATQAGQPGVIGPIKWPDGTTHYFYSVQSPKVWNNGCLCFVKDDISLVADPRYGKQYRVAVTTGDTNPWHASQGGTLNGAGQLSQRRQVALGSWTWFASAWKIDAWKLAPNQLFFCDLLSLGYQTSSNDQFALVLYGDDATPNVLRFGVDVNAGQTGQNGHGTVQGNAVGTTHIHKDHVVDATLGVWHELVVGVKGATDETGAIEIHHRIPGASDWTQVYNKTGIDTYLYGVVTDSHGTLIRDFARDASNWPEVIDKMGLYFGLYNGQVATEVVETSGLVLCSDLATAKAQFPA